MYTEYFRLHEPPFSLSPDPRYLFMSERHREGLAHLVYGVEQPGGFVQLTGEIGSGKTTLSRCLVKQLPPETDVALILNPRMTAVELLATVCDELGVQYPAETKSVKTLVDALNGRLLEAHAQGRRTVLIIDEAQNLQGEVLEQIRLLTNLETAQQKLLQIILIGQPELITLLGRKDLRQLAQRITARYHLGALSRRETYAYIRHRLLVGGCSEQLFTRGAMRRVYRLSGGMPRLINIVCDRALLGAYALDKRNVTSAIVRRASRETRGVVPRRGWRRAAFAVGIAALAVLTLGGAISQSPATLSMLRWSAKRVTSAVNPVGPASADTDKASHETESTPTLAGSGEPSSPKESDSSTHGEIQGSTAEATGEVGVQQEPSDLTPVNHKPLAEILADPSLRGTSASSFTSLYARWGLELKLQESGIGCEAAKAHGFECLFRVGNWTRLRRYDIPAILELILADGKRHHVTLVGLGEDRATLVLGGREYTFPLLEIDKVWDGSFILVWNHSFGTRQLVLGDRGKDVTWVRRALDTIEGKHTAEASADFYDEGLRQRVIAFQRNQGLPTDGYVGNETLVRLNLALEGQAAPSISRYEHE